MTRRHIAWIGVALAATATFVGLAVLTPRAESQVLGSTVQRDPDVVWQAVCKTGPGAFEYHWASECFDDEGYAHRMAQNHFVRNGKVAAQAHRPVVVRGCIVTPVGPNQN